MISHNKHFEYEELDKCIYLTYPFSVYIHKLNIYFSSNDTINLMLELNFVIAQDSTYFQHTPLFISFFLYIKILRKTFDQLAHGSSFFHTQKLVFTQLTSVKMLVTIKQLSRFWVVNDSKINFQLNSRYSKFCNSVHDN